MAQDATRGREEKNQREECEWRGRMIRVLNIINGGEGVDERHQQLEANVFCHNRANLIES